VSVCDLGVKRGESGAEHLTHVTLHGQIYTTDVTTLLTHVLHLVKDPPREGAVEIINLNVIISDDEKQ